MPNLCYNQMSIRHPDVSYLREVGNKLLSSLEKNNHHNCDNDTPNNKNSLMEFFNILHPRPKMDDVDIHKWNQEYWGTTREPLISEFVTDKDDYTIHVTFETAWSPPIGVYEHLVHKNWNVDAFYHESGMEFCGRFTNDNDDECYNYDSCDKSSFKYIPQAILEFTCLMDDDETDEDDDES